MENKTFSFQLMDLASGTSAKGVWYKARIYCNFGFLFEKYVNAETYLSLRDRKDSGDVIIDDIVHVYYDNDKHCLAYAIK